MFLSGVSGDRTEYRDAWTHNQYERNHSCRRRDVGRAMVAVVRLERTLTSEPHTQPLAWPTWTVAGGLVEAALKRVLVVPIRDR